MIHPLHSVTTSANRTDKSLQQLLVHFNLMPVPLLLVVALVISIEIVYNKWVEWSAEWIEWIEWIEGSEQKRRTRLAAYAMTTWHLFTVAPSTYTVHIDGNGFPFANRFSCILLIACKFRSDYQHQYSFLGSGIWSQQMKHSESERMNILLNTNVWTSYFIPTSGCPIFKIIIS